jgi:hypothetical protein
MDRLGLLVLVFVKMIAIYNATSSIVRFENTCMFFYINKTLLQRCFLN